MTGVGERVGGEEVFEESAGAKGGGLGKGGACESGGLTGGSSRATAGEVRLSRGRREARVRMAGSLARSRARPIALARLRLWGMGADWAEFHGMVAWGASNSFGERA